MEGCCVCRWGAGRHCRGGRREEALLGARGGRHARGEAAVHTRHGVRVAVATRHGEGAAWMAGGGSVSSAWSGVGWQASSATRPASSTRL